MIVGRNTDPMMANRARPACGDTDLQGRASHGCLLIDCHASQNVPRGKCRTRATGNALFLSCKTLIEFSISVGGGGAPTPFRQRDRELRRKSVKRAYSAAGFRLALRFTKTVLADLVRRKSV
jgi:hypothetical protein